MWNENFIICENVSIPYVSHMWNIMWNFLKGMPRLDHHQFIQLLNLRWSDNDLTTSYSQTTI